MIRKLKKGGSKSSISSKKSFGGSSYSKSGSTLNYSATRYVNASRSSSSSKDKKSSSGGGVIVLVFIVLSFCCCCGCLGLIVCIRRKQILEQRKIQKIEMNKNLSSTPAMNVTQLNGGQAAQPQSLPTFAPAMYHQ